jgi:oligogalacturonide transporter
MGGLLHHREACQEVKVKKSLSMRRILAFATGDIFGGGSFNITNFLYPGYVALAVGLPARTAGLIMMAVGIFDAVTDPIMGFLSDRMRVRFGTRRGGLLISAPLIVLSLFMAFYPYSNPSTTIRFWAVMLSYIFFTAVQTAVMIPYFSLSSEMTEDYTERARMTSVRLGFSIFSSIVCVAVPGIIVNAFEGNTGYIAMSLIFGTVFALCVGVTGLFAKEGIPPPKKAEPLIIKDFIRPFEIKPFRQYLWLYLCCQMTMAIMSALFFFYVDFYFCAGATARGEGNIVGMLGAAIMFSMQIVALPVYMAVIKKAGKTAVYILGSAIWIISAPVLLLVPADSNPVYMYILAAVMGFGISGPGLIPHAIFGDVVDVGHLQFGARVAGAFSGIANFVNKIAQAIGLAVVMGVIGLAGFVEQDISEGAAKVVEQPQSAQNAIILLMAFAPLVFMSFGIWVCTRYRLNKERHAQVLAALEGNEEEKAAVLNSL